MSDDEDSHPLHHRRWEDDDKVLAPRIILRIQYACYLLFGMVAAYFFRSISELFDGFEIFRAGCSLGGEVLRNACTSEVMVYRVSFALALFFFLHWLSVSDLTCCIRSSDRAEMQQRFFYAKSILLILIFIGTLFIPNSFFVIYAYVCLGSSALFLLMNVVFLVDFSYRWSDDWGERADSNPKWMWYLLIIAIGSFVIALVVDVVGFYVFVPHSECNLHAFAITSVLVGALIFTVLSIWVPHGSIVPSGIVFLYGSWIMFSTLLSDRGQYCNRLATSSETGTSWTEALLGNAITIFAVVYAVVSAGGYASAMNVGQDDDGDDENPDDSGHLSHYMFFYFIMILGSMYMAMYINRWHISGGGESRYLSGNKAAYWVRSGTVWMTMIMYVWSLVAPYTCCKGRDFGFDVDDDWL